MLSTVVKDQNRNCRKESVMNMVIFYWAIFFSLFSVFSCGRDIVETCPGGNCHDESNLIKDGDSEDDFDKMDDESSPEKTEKSEETETPDETEEPEESVEAEEYNDISHENNPDDDTYDDIQKEEELELNDRDSDKIIIEAPVVDGETSSGHNTPGWRWNTPEGATEFQFRLDKSDSYLKTVDNFYIAEHLNEGVHNFSVKACNSEGECSEESEFTTKVEYFGLSLPDMWKGVKKEDIPETAIGNIVPLTCHNCYNGPGNEVYDFSRATAKIDQAVERKSDFIELDIIYYNNDIYVCHSKEECGEGLSLRQFLENETLRTSSAMLSIEIKEDFSDENAFAEALLTLFDENRDYVKNGRLLLLRSFNYRLRYLKAAKERLNETSNMFLKHYLKFSILFDKYSAENVENFRALVKKEVSENGFHFAEFDYQTKNLFTLLRFSQSLGLGAGIFTIPGEHGDVLISTMRENVDLMTVEYRIDKAREIIENRNTVAFLDASRCSSAGDETVAVERNYGGEKILEERGLGTETLPDLYGSPNLYLNDEDSSVFSCALDYRAESGISQRAISLGGLHLEADEGVLVTAVVKFANIDNYPEFNMGIVNKSENGGFGLQLGKKENLQFLIAIDGSYRSHSYSIDGTGLKDNVTINTDDLYYLTGVYKRNGSIFLFIDNMTKDWRTGFSPPPSLE